MTNAPGPFDLGDNDFLLRAMRMVTATCVLTIFAWAGCSTACGVSEEWRLGVAARAAEAREASLAHDRRRVCEAGFATMCGDPHGAACMNVLERCLPITPAH